MLDVPGFLEVPGKTDYGESAKVTSTQTHKYFEPPDHHDYHYHHGDPDLTLHAYSGLTLPVLPCAPKITRSLEITA